MVKRISTDLHLISISLTRIEPFSYKPMAKPQVYDDALIYAHAETAPIAV